MKSELMTLLKSAKRAALFGHIRPDGDCIGACLGLRQYLEDNFCRLETDVYLEVIPGKFDFLNGANKVLHNFECDINYDLAICLDCSEPERMGGAKTIFDNARHTVCIDHHASNEGFGMLCILDENASSTCELLYELLEPLLISSDCAKCLYTGIVHDTGVFKHSNTTKKTMETAGALIEKGAFPEQIIADSFYKKSFKQNQLLGLALFKSELRMGGKLISSRLTGEDLELFQAKTSDMDGIIDQLHSTDGVLVSAFLYQLTNDVIKVSLRARGDINVALIASAFGGGGHIKAAGFETGLEAFDILEKIEGLLGEQL